MENYELKSDWLEVEYVEREEEEDLVPSFEYEGEIYYLDNFIRCHNNPWISDNFPENIHGYEANNYWNPIFIEIAESGDCVRVYKTVA